MDTRAFGAGGKTSRRPSRSSEFEIERLIDVDDQRVLSVQRTVGRFRHTGIPVDNRWASLYWIRGGKIARAVGYPSERRALRAAGLSE
jgi:ketosteroid isomerase-like protein